MPTAVQFKPDEKKVQELILYLAKKSEEDPNYGMVKLNKLLFFCDYLWYAKTGRPITGAEYQRLPLGPCLRRMLPIKTAMEERGDAAVQKREVFGGRIQDRLIALREPKLGSFSGEEIAFVNWVIELFHNHNAQTISAYTHDRAFWQAFQDKEIIPYEAVFVTNRPLTARERAHATTIKLGTAPGSRRRSVVHGTEQTSHRHRIGTVRGRTRRAG